MTALSFALGLFIGTLLGAVIARRGYLNGYRAGVRHTATGVLQAQGPEAKDRFARAVLKSAERAP